MTDPKPSMSPDSSGTAEDTSTSTENPGSEKMATNPDPRANANVDSDDVEEGDTNTVGSEITDGEAS